MAERPNMISYFNEQTRISILVPETWTGQMVHQAQFRLFGPGEPDFDDYRPTMSYLLGQPGGYGEVWFEQIIRQSDQEMRRDYHAFQLLGERRFSLSSLAPTYVRRFEWRDQDTGLHFSQLQSLVLASEAAMYLINAATLKSLEHKHTFIFEEILESTRIIPPKP